MIRTGVSKPVLLYDGTCGFCNRCVQFILKHDRPKTMSFAALQGDYSKSVLKKHQELNGVDSLVYVAGSGTLERVFTRSDAALHVASYLGAPWNLALAAYLIPRPIRDYLYDQFARNRYRWFGKHESCLLPSPDVRERFLG